MLGASKYQPRNVAILKHIPLLNWCRRARNRLSDIVRLGALIRLHRYGGEVAPTVGAISTGVNFLRAQVRKTPVAPGTTLLGPRQVRGMTINYNHRRSSLCLPYAKGCITFGKCIGKRGNVNNTQGNNKPQALRHTPPSLNAFPYPRLATRTSYSRCHNQPPFFTA